VLEATAQHYGIKTSLLDFTSDPAVAVWFACAGGSNGDIASVFALPMAMGSLFDQGVLLCHPLALRPYRQRGLFIHDSPDYLKRLLIEIRFPIDTRFRILRDRLPTELHPQDEWWATSATAPERRPIPTSPGFLEQTNGAIEESLLHMLQMLMELTTFDVSSDTRFNSDTIAQIAGANARLLLACDSALRIVATKHFRGTMGQLILPRLLGHLRRAARR
jgi:hypothetical protein